MAVKTRIPEPPSFAYKTKYEVSDIIEMVSKINDYLFELSRYLDNELDG